MDFDVDRARRDTPGVAQVAHLNNAGAALPPSQVTEAVVSYLCQEGQTGGYELAAAEAERIGAVYPAVARLLGCGADEVALVENATRAWDMAFYSLGFDDDSHGQISVADLRRRLETGHSGPVRLIALTHVPTQGGLVNPAEEVGAVERQAGVPFLLDACQSAGQMALDVDRIGCDMLSGTGRKFLRGPRGTGFLYVRRSMLDQLEPPFLDLHAATWTAADRYEVRPDARRFECWETSYALRIGLGVAVEYALGWGLDAIEARVTALASSLRSRLQDVPGVQVHDQGVRRCGIVTFTVGGVPAKEVQRHLAEHGVNTSVSPVDSAQLDLPRRGLSELVRASVHYYNTDAELDQLIAALPAAR